MERVHSQVFAWIFSADCQAIDAIQKDELFQSIFQPSSNSNIINIQTERDGIDILIQTNKEIVIVENKIKSSQHSNQLQRYKDLCERMFPSEQKHYYFLTLIGEHTDHQNWKRISYSQIYNHLKSLHFNPNSNHAIILKEYLMFLDRLVSVIEDFKQNSNKYDMVFLDGNKKKNEKIISKYSNDNEEFIATNQLETILQKCYLSSLVEMINNPVGVIKETRGVALVDFPIQQKIEYEGRYYETIIQLQMNTVKFAFIYGDDYLRSEKLWVDKIIPKMGKLSLFNDYGYNKLNKPTSKAYISISKKLDEHYWHKKIDNLVDLIKSEIENGKSLTEQLIKLLN